MLPCLDVRRTWLAALALGLVPLPAASMTDCGPTWTDKVTIHRMPAGALDQAVVISVRNANLAPVTLRLELYEVANVRPSPATGEVVLTVPAGAEREAMRLERADIEEPWSWKTRWTGTLGDPAAQPDGALYELPFDTSLARLVVQGPGGADSHREGANRQAIDFAMPIGTEVRAARDGLVVEAVGCHRLGGSADWVVDRANRVIVLHADGTLGIYLHLRHEAVFVEEGDRVRAGQPIAQSGQTGWAPRPHLHFAAYKAGPRGHAVGLPVRFALDRPGPWTWRGGWSPREDDRAPPTPSPMQATPWLDLFYGFY